MGISGFTALSTFMWVSLFISAAVFFRHKGLFYRGFSVKILFFIIFLCLLRMFVPIEILHFTRAINSRLFMHLIYCLMVYPLFEFSVKGYTIAITLSGILITISAAGSLVTLCMRIKESRAFNSLIAVSQICKDARVNDIVRSISEALGIKRDIKVVVNQGFPSPAIAGIFRIVIVMPHIDDFSDEQLKGIFVHELMHYKHKHLFIKLLASLIEILFWWNPLMHIFRMEIDNSLEFHADSKLIEILNYREQREYLRSITKVADKNVKTTFLSEALGLDSLEKNVVWQRCKLICQKCYSKRYSLNDVLVVLALCTVFILSYSFVIQPYGEPTYEDYHDDAPTISPDCYIVAGEDTYTIYSAEGEELETKNMPIEERVSYLEVRKAKEN